MATYSSTVAQNENIHILRGKGIGSVKADVPKPEKKDRKDRKALRDLSKPAKHLGSRAVEASTWKQKSSQHGNKTTKKTQTSNILTDEETKKCFEWAEEEVEKVHFTGNDILKQEKDAIDKRVKDEVDMVMSCMGEWNRILYDYPTPVKKLDDDIEDITMLELEPEILLPWPSISPTSEKILPVVKKQHLLLCTLLICNAAAMEALPIFLDSLVTAWGAILISVTLILLFGEIIPQAVCSRYGLAIGAAVAPAVRVLVWICSPLAYPISKLLDFLLGHGHVALFRRAELKTLVTLHGNEAGKGGELTHDETTIIAGALELSAKKASDAMTPISETFAVDINAKLDRELMQMILDKGHSRVPVYYEQPTNIIGLILVKNLLSIHPADEVPVKNVTIRKIPRVPVDMPLYDILNEFQKGHSHMAVVVKQGHSPEQPVANSDGDVKVDIDGNKPSEKNAKSHRPIHKWKSFPGGGQSFKGSSRGRSRWSRDAVSDVLKIDEDPLPKLNEEEEAVGIITMEDVIEELLQEEIYDETDYQES